MSDPSTTMATMRESSSVTTIHIVEGTPWQDALIRVVAPESPLRPWQVDAPVSPGDAVIVVLDTDPQSVLAGVGVLPSDGDVDSAIAAIKPFYLNGLLELGTLNMLADFVVRPEEATVYHSKSLDRVVEMIGDCCPSTPDALFGHTSLAAGRVLLQSRGKCTACDRALNLSGPDARDHLHIHTVERRARGGDVTGDWPATLCDTCAKNMRQFGFEGFLAYKFFLNGSCPQCSAFAAQQTHYGMPARRVEEPWIAMMGCVWKPWNRVCALCDHQWVEE